MTATGPQPEDANSLALIAVTAIALMMLVDLIKPYVPLILICVGLYLVAERIYERYRNW